jgi:hypothetical protein
MANPIPDSSFYAPSSQDSLDRRARMMTHFNQNLLSVGPQPGGLLRVVAMRQPQRWRVRKEGDLPQPAIAIAAARGLEGGYRLAPLCMAPTHALWNCFRRWQLLEHTVRYRSAREALSLDCPPASPGDVRTNSGRAPTHWFRKGRLPGPALQGPGSFRHWSLNVNGVAECAVNKCLTPDHRVIGILSAR